MNPLRPSNAERRRVLAAVAKAHRRGWLLDHELDVRSRIANDATTIGELEEALKGVRHDLQFPTSSAENGLAPIPSEPAPRWGRRGALALGAAALGFGVAGGGRLLWPLLANAGSDLKAKAPGKGPRPLTPGGMDEPLAWLENHGYTRFTDLTLHDDMVTAEAIAPGQTDAVDRIVISSYENSAEPRSTLPKNARVFGVDDVRLDLVPAIIEVAPKVMGSPVPATYLIVDFWTRELTMRPYCAGDAYGRGSGYAVWSADGQRLLAVMT